MQIPDGMSTIAFIMQQKGITVTSVYNGIQTDNKWQHRSYSVTIKGANFSFTTEYKRGMGHEKREVSPDDIISSFVCDADCFTGSTNFDDFASNFGYPMDEPEDRHKARRIYNACEQNHTRLGTMFTEEEMQIIRDYMEEKGL